MTYEYDFEYVLNPKDNENAEMGLVDFNSIQQALKKLLNERAKKGWEPIAPFMMPVIWFRKTKK